MCRNSPFEFIDKRPFEKVRYAKSGTTFKGKTNGTVDLLDIFSGKFAFFYLNIDCSDIYSSHCFVTRMKWKDLSDSSSDEFSSLFFFTVVIDEFSSLFFFHSWH